MYCLIYLLCQTNCKLRNPEIKVLHDLAPTSGFIPIHSSILTSVYLSLRGNRYWSDSVGSAKLCLQSWHLLKERFFYLHTIKKHISCFTCSVNCTKSTWIMLLFPNKSLTEMGQFSSGTPDIIHSSSLQQLQL